MKKLVLTLPIVILSSCFPSFKPKEKIMTDIQQDSISLRWIKVIGTLDQNFPDYIIIYQGDKIDTICKSHNIANLQMRKDTIAIGFYGVPKIYDRHSIIPKEVFGYKIKINTDFR